jgi:hypothetical protein
MQKGILGARESADASLREMLAHLNVIDAGIARIGESRRNEGSEVTGAARDLLSRLELIAFLAARVHVHDIPRLTDALEELVLAAQLQPLPRHDDVAGALRHGVDVLMLLTHDAMRRMHGHPAAELQGAIEALFERVDRIISNRDAISRSAYKLAGL